MRRQNFSNPYTVGLFAAGIVFLVFLPPVGVLLFLAAAVLQVAYMGQHAAHKRAVRAQQYELRREARAKAFRSFRD